MDSGALVALCYSHHKLFLRTFIHAKTFEKYYAVKIPRARTIYRIPRSRVKSQHLHEDL